MFIDENNVLINFYNCLLMTNNRPNFVAVN